MSSTFRTKAQHSILIHPKGTVHNITHQRYFYVISTTTAIFALVLTVDPRAIKGRLKLCSQSLFFDPHDDRLAIIRYPYSHVTLLEAWNGAGSFFSSLATDSDTFVIKTKRIVQMRENNVIEPYKVTDVSTNRYLSSMFTNLG